jgi:membrane protein CcdC involved in cytochrome C biogenesis
MAQVVTAIVVIAMVIAGIWIKQRRAAKPIKGNGFRFLIPVFFFLIMFGLFALQVAHLPQSQFVMPASWEFVMAFVLGLLFGIPLLIKTSYEIREDGLIYSKPSKGFLYIFVALIGIRIGLKEYFQGLDPIALALLSFTLAFAYVGVWRIGSFVKYRKVWSSIRIK